MSIDATANLPRYRDLARALIPEFVELYIHCILEVCRERESTRQGAAVEEDLYAGAEAGEDPHPTPPGCCRIHDGPHGPCPK